jgi:hypothetical protein
MKMILAVVLGALFVVAIGHFYPVLAMAIAVVAVIGGVFIALTEN